MAKPLFTVIIPAHGRPNRLGSCLEGMTHLQSPKANFEVIVIDDGSKIPLEPVITPFKQRLVISHITQANVGPAAARNGGAAMARGEYLIFTDDDCVPAPDWLNCYEARFAEHPTCAIGGHTINALSDNVYSEASQMLIDYLYGYYNQNECEVSFLTSNNFAVSARLFHEIGGFDATMPLAGGEDREFCDRWLHHGHRMLFAPEAITYHFHSLSLSRFLRQHFSYGRGACFFHQRRAERNDEGIRVEPSAFYVNLLRYPFALTERRKAVQIASLFIFSQAANAAGFGWERMRQSRFGSRMGHKKADG